jgi:hypothetical protein
MPTDPPVPSEPIAIVVEKQSALDTFKLLNGRIAIPPELHADVIDFASKLAQALAEPLSDSTELAEVQKDEVQPPPLETS